MNLCHSEKYSTLMLMMRKKWSNHFQISDFQKLEYWQTDNFLLWWQLYFMKYYTRLIFLKSGVIKDWMIPVRENLCVEKRSFGFFMPMKLKVSVRKKNTLKFSIRKYSPWQLDETILNLPIPLIIRIVERNQFDHFGCHSNKLTQISL